MIDPILTSLGVPFRTYDCTDHEHRFRQTVASRMPMLKDEFVSEASNVLWEGRIAEVAAAEEVMAKGHVRKIYVATPATVAGNH